MWKWHFYHEFLTGTRDGLQPIIIVKPIKLICKSCIDCKSNKGEARGGWVGGGGGLLAEACFPFNNLCGVQTCIPHPKPKINKERKNQ